MTSRDHIGAALRRGAARQLPYRLASVVCLFALLLVATPAVAAERTPIEAARDALRLTDQRLSLMDELMVTSSTRGSLTRSPTSTTCAVSGRRATGSSGPPSG